MIEVSSRILTSVFITCAGIVSAQAPYKAARSADGHPNLNGIWQTNNTANWDILAHAARPALMTVPGPAAPIPAPPVLAFGAVGAVPGGNGVVEGDEIPYQSWAIAKKKKMPSIGSPPILR